MTALAKRKGKRAEAERAAIAEAEAVAEAAAKEEAEITVKKKPISNPYWNNTTTNYMLITNCEYAINWRWREKPYSNSWINNDTQVLYFSIGGRWARGWSDARGAYCVNA